MTTMSKRVTCGIYDTFYTAKINSDSVELRLPYIRWVGNNGNLAFDTQKITNPATVRAVNDALAGNYPVVDEYGDGYADYVDFIFKLLLSV